LEITVDVAGNMYMTLPGRSGGEKNHSGQPSGFRPQGGNYDGAAGVLAGLAALAA